MIEQKFYNRFFHKSKTTSCSTYSRDHTQLRIYGLFYLNLLNINTHACDFEIPLKTLDHQQQLILYVATYLHWFLYTNLLSDRCLLSQKVTKPHKSHKSNSQGFQELLKCIQGFSFIPVVLDTNPRHFCRLWA